MPQRIRDVGALGVRASGVRQLSYDMYRALMARHTDHHLQQFNL